MDNEYRLSARQILTRIISVIVAGVGGSACGFSLLMQVQEIGTIIASITWFSGLLAVEFGWQRQWYKTFGIWQIFSAFSVQRKIKS